MWEMLSGLLGLGGGISGLLGSLGIGRQDIPYKNANPYTEGLMKQFQSALEGSDQNFNRLSGQTESISNKMGGVQGALKSLFDKMGTLSSPGLNEGFNLFNKRKDSIMNTAQDAATMFTQPYKEKGADIAKRRASQAAQKMMSQFGGSGFSGAANAASSGAATDVMAGYETDLAKMFADIGGGLTAQGLGAERGMAEQAPQTQFANLMNLLLQQGNFQTGIGNSLGAQGSLMANLANMAGNRSNNLMGNLTNLGMPSYAEQMTSSPLGAFGEQLGGLGDLFGNADFQGLFNQAPTASPSQPTYKSPNNYNNWTDYYLG